MQGGTRFGRFGLRPLGSTGLPKGLRAPDPPPRSSSEARPPARLVGGFGICANNYSEPIASEKKQLRPMLGPR
eukprot:8522288-Alexandrium_andersonii.AAC.1